MIEVKAALEACSQATLIDRNPRFQYQLGRVHFDKQDHAAASRAFGVAAASGYLAAKSAHLRALIGGKVNQAMIERNWPDILRIAATIAAGTVAPSQILRKLASYPRQNELATALREVGRVERTLFMIDWILDAELQRRAQIGLNKGEAHHALKRAISFHRRGEIRDRSAEGQHYRIAGMNLLAAIIIFWNTMKLGEVVANQKRDGKLLSPDLLAHVSPLGWAHINLTGEYRWPKP